MIMIYVALIAPGLCNYSMNAQDLTNLWNKRIRYDRHAKNYMRNIIEDKTIDEKGQRVSSK